MDFYRCKFHEYTPHSITSLAFSHGSDLTQTAPKNLRLAVGRANGDIEIWNPRFSWVHDLTIKGGRNRSIEGLAWSAFDNKLRLFSIGGSTAITEWDLKTGLPIRHHDCDAGIIWSIAVSPDGTKLAAGCDDGSVVIVDIGGGQGVMEQVRILQRQKSRVLSIAWKDEFHVVGGCADGRIRIWMAVDPGTSNSTTAGLTAGGIGRIVQAMRVDKSSEEQTLVWAILVLDHGRTIVSGDSTGAVKFWDGKHSSLLQTFQAHEADILCLAANASGDDIFSAGVDRKIVQYSIVNAKLRRWASLSNRVLHSQDIRALAIYQSSPASFENWLVSGGVEKSIVISSVAHFLDGSYRKITVAPQKQAIFQTDSRKLTTSWSDSQVKVWKIDQIPTSSSSASTSSASSSTSLPPSVTVTTQSPDAQARSYKKLIASLILSNDENITHAALARDGKYLAVSTVSEVKLFLLLSSKDQVSLKVKKISAPALSSQGAVMLAFDATSQHLVLISPESETWVYKLGQLDDDLQQLNVKEPDNFVDDEQVPYAHNISDLAFSPDGRYFAISTVSGQIDIYSWPERKYLHSLPRIPIAATSFSFSPDSTTLVVISAEMKVLQFQIAGSTTMPMTPWSRRNSTLLMKEFSLIVDKACGVYLSDSVSNSETDEPGLRAYLWGTTWVASVDFNRDIPLNRIPKRKRKGLSIGRHDAIENLIGTPNGTEKEKQNGITNGNGTPTGKVNGKLDAPNGHFQGNGRKKKKM
ncbi:WD40-repeat-containing domain protein [Lipomyces oligophaga]|uniref:WD40-repeat-containing domain protein n=1 Tax=Lipomyces oligophaga TaxID=45792 RepID=UPI0034CFF7FB